MGPITILLFLSLLYYIHMKERQMSDILEGKTETFIITQLFIYLLYPSNISWILQTIFQGLFNIY